MIRPNILLVALLLSLPLLASPFLASAQTATLCNQYQSGIAAPAGYGLSWNPLSSGKELLLSAVCEQNSVQHTVGSNVENQYVYVTGYFYDSAWRPFTLTGTFVQNATQWLLGRGTYARVSPGDYFWVGYVCHWSGTAWKCGCRDAACATNHWQLQKVERPAQVAAGQVAPPLPPGSYTLPSGAVRVTTSAELLSAIAAGSPRDIILANGTYDNASAFRPAAAHRLWAETLGGATLHAGVGFTRAGGTGAGAVRGLRFVVTDPAKTAEVSGMRTIIGAHEGWHGLKVEDTWITGSGAIDAGIFASAVNGVRIHRVVLRNFAQSGIRVSYWNSGAGVTVSAVPVPLISDVDVANVSHPDPSCCNGTSEEGIWIGNGAHLERIKVRNAGWSCLIAQINSNDMRWRDLDIDHCGASGIYTEFYTRRSTFEKFHIGRNVPVGFTMEWGGSYGKNEASSIDLTIQDGTIEAAQVGVGISECNKGTTVRRVAFKNQCDAAILDGGSKGGPYCGPQQNSYGDNDYSGIDQGAKQVDLAVRNPHNCQ